MTKTHDRHVHELAARWMEDFKHDFPASDFDALVDMLASEIQDMVEDFTNEDYRDITMKHLRRRQERQREAEFNRLTT